MKAEKVGSETLLARIVQLVSEAGRSRAPIQKLADEVSGWFVSAVLAIAIVSFVVWRFSDPIRRWGNALIVAISVTHYRVSLRTWVGNACIDYRGCSDAGAKQGVLIKDAEALELMEKVDTLVVR